MKEAVFGQPLFLLKAKPYLCFMDLRHLRENYSHEPLDEKSISQDPFSQFKIWFDEAMNAKLMEPNAMVLSTIDPGGFPHSRTVLLKEVKNNKFIFFTNYLSDKAMQIEFNPRVSLLFVWLELQRQVKITGSVEKISEEESIEYFKSRPFGSQIGAWVSDQSKPISGREILEEKLKIFVEKYKNKTVPKPEHWGGYAVAPISVEFWKGRPDRLHDRILYSRKDGSWDIGRLSP